MKGFRSVLWSLAMGIVVLILVFTLVGGVSVGEAAIAMLVAAVLSVLLLMRGVRREYELRSQGGDPGLRSSYNAQRERRGF